MALNTNTNGHQVVYVCMCVCVCVGMVQSSMVQSHDLSTFPFLSQPKLRPPLRKLREGPKLREGHVTRKGSGKTKTSMHMWQSQVEKEHYSTVSGLI